MNRRFKCETCCNELLVEGHLIYQRSIAKFIEADELMRSDFKKQICDAINIIEKRECLQRVATDEENKALGLLETYEKNCSYSCNIQICKPLFDEALEIFKIESAKVQEIKEELFKVLELLQEYEEIAAEGDYLFFNKWIPCLHEDK